ncbi:RNA polymerase factor sigma-32 [Wolbachia endosymbiont of Pentidionis agamae]|uniref:RNA polymerase factor sigma-32 n=1 Tax=Wolbachia endosymbiont of Pentidionis agamae TaxID=3110435 RepID=UPI002FCFDD0C
MLTSVINFPLLIDKETNLANYIAQVRKFPNLLQEEEILLAKNWRDHKDVTSAHKLIVSHLSLVVKVAMKFQNYGMSLMELIMEGNVGLMHAIKKFDPDLGFRFSTYAVWWIKAYIKDYILKSWSLIKIGTTQAQKKLFFSLRRIKNKILKYTGRESLTQEEVKSISDELSVSEEDVVNMDNRLTYKDQSLNKVSDHSQKELQEIIPSGQLNQEMLCQINEERKLKEQILNNALATLNERGRDIFIKRYMFDDCQTLDELSKKYNISRERIRQIAEQSMEKVKGYVRSECAKLGLKFTMG